MPHQPTRRQLMAAATGATAALAMPYLSRASFAAPPQNDRVRHLAYTDQGGRPDGVQVMVNRKHVYVGHMFSNGVTVIDVADPRQPKPVAFIAAPPNTRTHHLQTFGDLMLVVCGPDIPTLGKVNAALTYFEQSFADKLTAKADFAAGMKIYDISNPSAPREIAFMPVPGIGLNRIWYVGGRYAYLSAHLDGYTDHMIVIADVSDPLKPQIVGHWALPGMWRAGGETPTWTNQRVALHHMVVADTRGYAAWRDGGFTIMDVADPGNIKLLSHRTLAPPFPGGTHSPLPLPGRNLALVADESTSLNCAKGLSYTFVFDVREPTNPVSISTLPTPKDASWCRPGENFGPHNMHENRPDAFQSEDTIFVTYHNAGLRIFDIRNAFEPAEIGRFIPQPPKAILDPRPGYAKAPMTCDINVQPDGIMYLSDWNGGMNILEYTG